MIRQAISDAITDVFNAKLSEAVSDPWQNDNFFVTFTHLEYIHPCNALEDEFWLFKAQIIGRCEVRIFTDAKTPIDPFPVMSYLVQHPIFIEPDPLLVETGEESFCLKLKVASTRDAVDTQMNYIIPILECDIESGYLLTKKAAEERLGESSIFATPEGQEIVTDQGDKIGILEPPPPIIPVFHRF
jgi:hypothetical protein